MSSAMAWRAASLISSGAAKSGKPWERFTAPCFRARRVISRMTDSVNCSAFAESMRREIWAIVESGAVIAPSKNTERETRGHDVSCPYVKNNIMPVSAGEAGGRLRGHAGLPINHPVELGVTQDDLHVFAGFGERDGFDEFRDLLIIALGLPGGDAVFTRVVGGRGGFRGAKLLDQVGDINHAEFDVIVRLEELVLRVADFNLPGEETTGFGKHLHQANCIRVRNRVGLERGLLTNQASCKHGIEIILGRFAPKRLFVRQWKERFPHFDGNIAEFSGVRIGNYRARVGHTRAKMSLIEGRLRRLQKKTRRRSGKVSVLEFLFGGRVKGNRAESLRALPAFFGGHRNRLIERTKRRSRRNLFQEFGGIFFAWANLGEPSSRFNPKVSFREAFDGLGVEAARMRDIPRALGTAAQPVESVNSVCGSGILQQK